VPVNAHKVSKLVNTPKDNGIAPFNWLEDNDNYDNFGNDPKVDGLVPPSW
jgi:hypothetical protein